MTAWEIMVMMVVGESKKAAEEVALYVVDEVWEERCKAAITDKPWVFYGPEQKFSLWGDFSTPYTNKKGDN